MTLLRWNCRGLSTHREIRVLGEMLKTHKPDFLFLSETFSVSNKIEELSSKFDFSNNFSVYKQGRAGDLTILWKHHIMCEVTESSPNHKDIIVIMVFRSGRGEVKHGIFFVC